MRNRSPAFILFIYLFLLLLVLTLKAPKQLTKSASAKFQQISSREGKKSLRNWLN